MMEKLKQINKKELLLDILYDIIGGSLYAAGAYSFASKADFVTGGITGYAMILNYFIKTIPIGMWILILNIPIILYCLKTLGKRFLFHSLRTMVISTVLLDLVFPHLPSYTGDKLMAALFAGALSGAGLALIYWRGSSTGGTDFLILSLRKKMPHVNVGTISMIIDGSAILVSAFVFRRIDPVLQGLVMTVASATVVDKITNGFVTGQLCLVITSKGKEIADEIMEEVERGVTAIEATGMFSGQGKKVLMCACTRAEACRIRAIANRHDKASFVVLCPYDTAYGLGFQPADN